VRVIESPHSDQANREAARLLIPPTALPRSFGPFVTASLYRVTVSRTLRQTLRGAACIPRTSEAKKIEVEGWSESEARDQYLKDLRRLRDVMAHSKVGYIGYAGVAILEALKSKYPEAFGVFERELEAQ
jgi:hypothetical protein